MAPPSAAPTATTTMAPLRQLKEACETLRMVLLDLEDQKRNGKIDVAQLKEQRWQVIVLLSSLKARMRETFLAADAWKTRVQDQKDVVEAHQLKLQNLLYEKDHLVREIARCRGFSTKEMDQIEFVDGPLPIAVAEDVHRRHLDRLTQELEMRKQMRAQVRELKAKIDVVEAMTHTKQTFLEGLRGRLDVIEDSTTGLQQYMRTPVSAKLKLQNEASTTLPTPLYTLFCELEAYKAASGATKQMVLSIVKANGLKGQGGLRVRKRDFPSALLAGGRVSGSTQEPNAKRQKPPSRSPSVAPQQEQQSADGREHRAPSRSPSMARARPVENGEIVAPATEDGAIVEEVGEVKVVQNDNEDNDMNDHSLQDEGSKESDGAGKDLWLCHEKALLLQLSLGVADDKTAEFAIQFQYFPNAKTVTVEVVQPVLTDATILLNLFPGDDGQQLPHSSTAYQFMGEGSDKSETAFPSMDKAHCRPYHWAQWICGLFPLKRDEHDVTRRPEPSIRSTMEQLINRLVTSVQIKDHVRALNKSAHALVHPSFTSHFPSEIKTQLALWKEVTTPSQDLLSLFKDTTSTASARLSLLGCRYYRVSFKNSSGRIQIDAILEIAPEFPVRAPRFRLSNADSNNKSLDSHLREIEIEVNAHYDELTNKDTASFLLMHQLRKVQQCVDVLAHPDGDLPRCFGRERRGKDRRPTFVVDPVTKEQRHR